MRHPLDRRRFLAVSAAWAGGTSALAQQKPDRATPAAEGLTIVGAADNDLVRALQSGGRTIRLYESPAGAVQDAPQGGAVLLLADAYPTQRLAVAPELLAEARRKRLRVYLEYPEQIPGFDFESPRDVEWERAIVTANESQLSLPRLRILSPQCCRYLPTTAEQPLIVLGRVAGFDTAVYGLPQHVDPLLFSTETGVLVATTKLSDFVKSRFAPVDDWKTVWQAILGPLDPAGAPHVLATTPRVRPTLSAAETMPAAAERDALARCGQWLRNSGLLISADREPEIHALLREGKETTPALAADSPAGDGSCGILEGYASAIQSDGSQLQRTPIRADCQAESAAVLALHSSLQEDPRSEQIARNLLDYLYVRSELCQGDRGNPKHPAYGLIAWGAVSPAWRIANYGDDNARTLLATIAAAAALKSPVWDASVLKALYANLRTTGKLGFRGDRIDMPLLEQRGWKAIHDADTVNLSPSFEAYSWACYLWAYARTGDREFLDSTQAAIRRTMENYPAGWRWGDHLDRSRMLLPLAWLIRVDDTPEHRGWLKRVADDLLRNQQPCGAIPEELTSNTAGHFIVPQSNEAYGTSETPLIQKAGDPVTDQLYTTNFVLIGLHEAAAATGDPELRHAEDRLMEYAVRIQTRGETLPELDGTWFRAFDFHRWDYWSGSGDLGWGAWCAEAGWGPAWNAIVLGLRLRKTSLWDFTASSAIASQLEAVRSLMSQNDGQPWRG